MLYLKVLHDMVPRNSEINSWSSHHALEINVLKIEENYLTWQLLWTIKEHLFLGFRMLESKIVKFLMSVLKWKVDSSSNFALFFTVITHNYSVNFKVILFLIWTKGSHQSSNFDTIKCSGENTPNFSCLFSNHWPVFLQNLHDSSLSWKVTPLYFCSSNNIYFGHKEPI